MRTGTAFWIRRRILLALTLSLLLLACGYYGEDEETGALYKKIYSWQDREMKCLGYPYYNGDISNFQVDPMVLEVIRKHVRKSIRPMRDDPDYDYWATSCEAMDRGAGDCDEFATLAHKELRKLKFPDARIRMMIGERPEEESSIFHMFVAVYYSNQGFYIVDPAGGYTNKVVTWKEFSLRRSNIRLVLGFNLFSVWKY